MAGDISGGIVTRAETGSPISSVVSIVFSSVDTGILLNTTQTVQPVDQTN